MANTEYVYKQLEECDRIGTVRIVDKNNNYVLEPAAPDTKKYDALTQDIVWSVGDGVGQNLLSIAFIARLADIGIVCTSPMDVSCVEAGRDICEMRYTGNGNGVFVLDGEAAKPRSSVCEANGREDIADTIVDVRDVRVRYCF